MSQGRSNESLQRDELQQTRAFLKPSDYQVGVFVRGLRGERPVMTFDCNAWEDEARKTLSRPSFGFLYGSAGTRETTDNNVAAFKKWGLVPRHLVQFKQVDLSTTLFGRKFAYPLGLAPVGVMDLFHWRKELAVAKAAAECGVPFILSTVSSSTMEEVADANRDGERWFQLYWPRNEASELTQSLLYRAKKAGYTVLVVTIDTFVMPWRPMDLDQGYNPFVLPDATGLQIAFSDPVFRRMWKEKSGSEVEESISQAAIYWFSLIAPGYNHTWEDLDFLKKNWEGPIVLKGIQSIGDARRAVEAGIDGIVISNHGGRSVDGCVGSLDVLPEIADEVGEKIDIIFDSGIRSGVHIIKALALGAKFVLIGRPYVYGFAVDGEEGVKHVIRSLLGEFETSLVLSGISSVSKLVSNKEALRRLVS